MKPRCSMSKKSIFFVPSGHVTDLTNTGHKRRRGMASDTNVKKSTDNKRLKIEQAKVHAAGITRDKYGRYCAIFDSDQQLLHIAICDSPLPSLRPGYHRSASCVTNSRKSERAPERGVVPGES